MRFAFRRDVALGRYVPLDTTVHRLDPRTKTFLFALTLVVLFRSGPLLAGVVVVALAGVLALARIPLRRTFGAFRALAWILLVTFLFQWLWIGPRQLGGFAAGAQSGVTMVLRLAGMLLGATLLAATTEPIRLADGLGRLFGFLERVRVPVRDLALVLTLALRFLPTVMEEAERLAAAQRARGARFEGGLLTRARRMLPLAIPLFAGCLHRADVLALAMEARGFRSTGRERTSLEPLAMTRADLWTLAGGGVILGASLLWAPGI
ncbi:energy-coupling factor transporter transmembrane protein EcfT [bacterium]|nr:energy-coupling factor transporter transmembrane protein EcfT [bacterium]